VQTSIAQKQRDAQIKSSPSLSFPTLAKATVENSSIDLGGIDNAVALKTDSQKLALEQDIAKWKSAYESAMAENEHLRSRGEEANQASHWRERFETCERERNEALDKLRSVLDLNNGASTTGQTDFNALKQDLLGSGAIYQKYIALKEEFEVKIVYSS
jgi:hypothetical protein